MSQPKSSYDEVPYSSFTFPQTRPDRLATLASWYGMEPAPAERCRVLELGCGDGTNLLSFAYILPDSEFVGIDLSQTHVTRARNSAKELGLGNVEFRCEDVMEFDRESYGEFDYIIAHGLFSWVHDPVRDKILEIYSKCLAPQGVGYISYNAYPGCKTREILWDMMKFFTADVATPAQRVSAGLQFLNFINFASDKESAYASIMASELATYPQRTVENIYHDDFSELNRPFYFHEFVETIKPAGLQFLCEVDSFWKGSQLRPEIAAKLDELGDDVIKREQITDFIIGRPFRSTLVCRDTHLLNRKPPHDILRNFYIASSLETVDQTEVELSGARAFRNAAGEEVTVVEPLTVAGLHYLQSIWSGSASFDELMEHAADGTGVPDSMSVDRAIEELVSLFNRGMVDLHKYRPEFPRAASEKPRTSRFVQWQIRNKCSHLTTMSGMNVKPEDDLMQLLLLLCDGTRARDEVTGEVLRRIEFANANRDENQKRLPMVIEERLSEYARLGLFEA